MAALTKCFQSKASIACYILAICICLAIIIACIPLAIWIAGEQSKTSEELNNKDAESREVKGLWPDIPDEKPNTFRFASVACAEKNCSKIGVEMLSEGGSAVDAAIAVSLCLGVTRTTSSGIGGGGFMNYYKRSTKETYLLDYRETAPKAANATMYAEGSPITSKYGGGSIAVPGEIAGIWKAHQKYGKLPWARLFEPSIQLAENGIVLNEYVAGHMAKQYDKLNDVFREVITDPATGKVKKAGDTVVFTKMADSYRKIAREGIDTFYNGSLRDDIIADLDELDGSIITAEDLQTYKVEQRSPITGVLSNGDYTMTSLPPPSGGIVLQYILRILDGYTFTKDDVSPRLDHVDQTTTTYHRIVEAMKFAYALRSNLGDPNFSNITDYVNNMTSTEFANYIRTKITDDSTQDVDYYGANLVDHRLTTGTSQISVLAGNGDAVAVTTSVNWVFGSKRMGRRTGIVFNNLMDDFSRPGAPSWSDDAWVAPSNEANWIEPGKRPLSSMSPSIFTDKNGDVVLVTGGSGGSKIITAVAMTAINNLWFGMNLTEAVSRPRPHHQLLPHELIYEDGFPQIYLDKLKEKGHKLAENTFPPVSDSVSSQFGLVFGVGDPRRQGASDGY